MASLLPVERVRRTLLPDDLSALAALVQQYRTAARTAWHDFFAGRMPNSNTRAAYSHALRRFFAWCDLQDRDLPRITPGDVGDYFCQHTGSTLTKTKHLSVLRKFLSLLVERHIDR